MTSGPPDVQLFGAEGDVEILKALADKTRLRLLRLLHNEELNVQELCEALDLPQPSVSRHLAILRAAGLAADRREGNRIFYTLSDLRRREGPLAAYLAALGDSEHPDLDRLAAILETRTTAAHSFADRKAAQWDDIGKVLHSTSAGLLALGNMVPQPLTIADLGTGTGLLLPFLSVMAKTVFAVDQSGAMLKRARQRCRACGLTNVEFIHDPIEKLQDSLPPCDALLLHFVLHQMASPHAAIVSVAPLLAPGGRLVIVDRVQHQDDRAKERFGSLWLGFSRDQVAAWCEAAGLSFDYWHVQPGTDRPGDTPFAILVAAARR